MGQTAGAGGDVGPVSNLCSGTDHRAEEPLSRVERHEPQDTRWRKTHSGQSPTRWIDILLNNTFWNDVVFKYLDSLETELLVRVG